MREKLGADDRAGDGPALLSFVPALNLSLTPLPNPDLHLTLTPNLILTWRRACAVPT